MENGLFQDIAELAERQIMEMERDPEEAVLNELTTAFYGTLQSIEDETSSPDDYEYLNSIRDWSGEWSDSLTNWLVFLYELTENVPSESVTIDIRAFDVEGNPVIKGTRLG